MKERIDYDVVRTIGVWKSMVAHKNYVALSGYEFVALYAIELARNCAQDVYSKCVKRPDIFKFEAKKRLGKIVNEKGNSYAFDAANHGKSYVGAVRHLNMLYKTNLTDDEICSMADMADYFDKLVMPFIDKIRRKVLNIIGAADTLTKNHGLIQDLFMAYLTACICKNITDNVDKRSYTTDGEPVKVYLCKNPNQKSNDKHAGIPIDQTFPNYIADALWNIIYAVLGKEGFGFDFGYIEDEIMKVTTAMCNPRNISIAVAFGGVDFAQPTNKRVLRTDTEALVNEVISRFDQAELEHNREDIKSLFVTKGWTIK